MEVTEILVRATQAIEEANVPNDVRPVAFGKAVDMLLQLTTNGAGGSVVSNPRSPDKSSITSQLASLCEILDIEPNIASSVFNVNDEAIEIRVHPSKLAPKLSAATKQVALLFVAARQGTRFEEYTLVSEIRAQCLKMGVLDATNFSASIKSMKELIMSKGTGTGREVKMNRQGWIEAAALVKRLAGIAS